MARFTPQLSASSGYRASVNFTPGQPTLWCRLSCLVGIVTIISIIATAYVHLNQKEASLRKTTSDLEQKLSQSKKELDNLRVIVESHKGPCILRQAQALGLQPPVAGQIIQLQRNQPATHTKVAEMVSLSHDFPQRNQNTP